MKTRFHEKLLLVSKIERPAILRCKRWAEFTAELSVLSEASNEEIDQVDVTTVRLTEKSPHRSISSDVISWSVSRCIGSKGWEAKKN